MILVTVGQSYYQFDRLLRAVDMLAATEDVVVQYGPSNVRPSRATCVDFLPFEELVEHIRRARVVVTHGGVGSILVALASGKRPLVVPRLRRFGEAVDDHQLESARKLAEAGLVRLVEDPAELPDAIAEPTEEPETSRSRLGQGSLAAELREYLAMRIGVRSEENARMASQMNRSV